MTNFPTVANVGDLADALQNKVKVKDTSSKAGIQFLKNHYTTGEWSLGAERLDMTGETLIINTQSIMHGWQLWVDSKLEEDKMAPFIQDLPIEPEPVETRNRKGQTETIYAREARSLQGMYEGDLVEFAGTSHGVLSCIDTLLNAIRARSFEDKEFLYPEVKLSCAEPYENKYKKGEMVHNPVFEIVGWYNMAGDPAPDAKPALEKAQVEDDGEEDEAPAPTRRRRRKA